MPDNDTITAERLRSILDYDPDTGIFIWRKRSDITPSRIRNMWNSRWAGKQAGSPCQSHGYRAVSINHVHYLMHRLAWLYVHGEWPAETIDHINRDRLDNRISNLRLATPSQQMSNHPPKNNITGLPGVTFHKGKKAKKRYSAKISVNRTTHSLGYFETPEEAHEVYKKAARDLLGEFCPDHLR